MSSMCGNPGCPICHDEVDGWVEKLAGASASASALLTEMSYLVAKMGEMIKPIPVELKADWFTEGEPKDLTAPLATGGKIWTPLNASAVEVCATDSIAKLLPTALTGQVELPCACRLRFEFHLMDAIIHLNDRHHPDISTDPRDAWTRERIADWLDSLPIDLTITTTEETS